MTHTWCTAQQEQAALRRRERAYAEQGDWMDYEGNLWSIVTSSRRLKFGANPGHAALRRHVFWRDRFTCQHCLAVAAFVPLDYDGRTTLFTNTMTGTGNTDVLIVDHVLTLRAGGRSVPWNLQTLCETCNRQKIPEDVERARQYRQGLAR